MFDSSFTFNSLWSWKSLRSWWTRWSWNSVSSTISCNCEEEMNIKVLMNYAGNTSQAFLLKYFVMLSHFSLRFLVFLVGLDHLDYTCDISCYP